MLAAIIDNGSTWLLNIKDDVEISLDKLKSEWSDRHFGWLVNTEDISDIIWGMPVSRFILRRHDGSLRDITIKQAHFLYDQIVECRKNNNVENSILKK